MNAQELRETCDKMKIQHAEIVEELHELDGIIRDFREGEPPDDAHARDPRPRDRRHRRARPHLRTADAMTALTTTPELTCWYCEREGHPGVRARFTVHDSRGCIHCCHEHARWRMTTSMSLVGHGKDCPYAGERTAT